MELGVIFKKELDCAARVHTCMHACHHLLFFTTLRLFPRGTNFEEEEEEEEEGAENERAENVAAVTRYLQER